MSIDADKPGGKQELEELGAEVKREFDAAIVEEVEAQEELFEPLTSEELVDAAEGLGPGAGRLAVLKAAREARRRGRPKGAKNKRTTDLVAYLSQFGPDPLVAAMRIVAEDELAMVALSAQVDPAKKQLAFAEARALRIRCIELLAPYFHGKQPVQIDARITGVRVVEQIGDVRRPEGQTIDGAIKGVMPVDAESGE